MGRRPEYQALGDYLIYRAYYELHLYHFAQRGFYALLNRPVLPGTVDIAIAGLGCMNQMYVKNPAMNVSLNVNHTLSGIPVDRLRPAQKRDLWQSVFMLARGKDRSTG